MHLLDYKISINKYDMLANVKHHLESGGQICLNIIGELGTLYNVDNEEALFLLMRLDFYNLKSFEYKNHENALIIIINV